MGIEGLPCAVGLPCIAGLLDTAGLPSGSDISEPPSSWIMRGRGRGQGWGGGGVGVDREGAGLAGQSARRSG